MKENSDNWAFIVIVYLLIYDSLLFIMNFNSKCIFMLYEWYRLFMVNCALKVLNS